MHCRDFCQRRKTSKNVNFTGWRLESEGCVCAKLFTLSYSSGNNLSSLKHFKIHNTSIIALNENACKYLVKCIIAEVNLATRCRGFGKPRLRFSIVKNSGHVTTLVNNKSSFVN